MNLKEAQLLFQAGALEAPVVKQQEHGEGWIVMLTGTHKLNPILEAARGHVRVFKRLDAAVGLLFELGFNGVNVVR
ncbi:MAG: hypothetical protein ACXWT1_10105 [Methylobacter sp.]